MVARGSRRTARTSRNQDHQIPTGKLPCCSEAAMTTDGRHPARRRAVARDGRAVCLFDEDGSLSDVAVRVLDERGTTTAQFALRGACPLSSIEVTTYSRDHAFLLRATAADCCVVPLQAASEDDGQRARQFGTWLRQRNNFAKAGRGAWLTSATDGSLELVIDRGMLSSDEAPRGPSSPAFPPPPRVPPPPPSMDNASRVRRTSTPLQKNESTRRAVQTRIYHLRRLNNWVKVEIIPSVQGQGGALHFGPAAARRGPREIYMAAPADMWASTSRRRRWGMLLKGSI